MTRITYNGKSLQFDGKSLNILPIIFDDWFLPSSATFELLYDNLYPYGDGNLAAGRYWTSTEINATNARSFDIGGNTFEDRTKSAPYRVRAVRSFTAGVGEYSLRDIGPAGGWIFFIDGTTYYEAAPSDQSGGRTWSNITNVLIGTTGTAIGTGQANTTAIINQAGHTDSAALLCDDLVV